MADEQRLTRSRGYTRPAAQTKEESTQERLIALMESDPKAFQELLEKVAGRMLVPHSDGQAEVLSAKERFLVLCAGRRWGKSQVGAARALKEARKTKKIIWWVAPTYKNVKHGYKAVIDQMPDGLLKKPAPPDSAFDAGRAVILEFKNGSRIQFFSAERPEGMLGGSCDYLILDEAATMPEVVWTQYLRATLADRQGGALFISTPRGRNWFYYIWKRGQSDHPEDSDFRSWRFPSRTNPTIPASEFDGLAAEMPAVEYEQEILAEFISEAASVFRMKLDKDGNYLCVREPAEPRGHVVLGIDLAKRSDFTVILGVNSDTRFPCYHDRFNTVSWPQQKGLIRDAISELEENPYVHGVTIMMDIGGPGDVIYDDLSEEGYDIIPINFTKWKENAVKLLAADVEQGNAFIHPDAVSEFEHYSYTITAGGRWRYEASRGHDDEVSAALLAHWGVVHEGAPDVHTVQFDLGGQVDYEDETAAAVDTGVPVYREYRPETPTTADLLSRDDVWG